LIFTEPENPELYWINGKRLCIIKIFNIHSNTLFLHQVILIIWMELSGNPTTIFTSNRNFNVRVDMMHFLKTQREVVLTFLKWFILGFRELELLAPTSNRQVLMTGGSRDPPLAWIWVYEDSCILRYRLAHRRLFTFYSCRSILSISICFVCINFNIIFPPFYSVWRKICKYHIFSKIRFKL